MTDRFGNIAIVGIGPVGTGEHGGGIPALVSSLEEMSADNTVTVYSLLRADPARTPRCLRVRCLPFRTPFRKLDLLMLSVLVVIDHMKRRFDVLHAIDAFPAGWICVVLGRVLRVPCLVALLGEEIAHLPKSEHGNVESSRRGRTAWVCRNAGMVTLLTEFQAQGLEAFEIRPRRTAIVPLGVSTSRFKCGAKQLGPPFVFLHVAYAHPVKGMDVLLEVFKIVSSSIDARLVIVGSNHVGGRTESAVDEMGLSDRVQLVRPVSNQALVDYYDRAHFLLHASWYESQGVVFNEAMASGVVVCSTNVGLAADLAGQCCVVGAVGQAPDLAEKILALAGDEHRYLELQSQALAWSNTHDVVWSTNEYRKIYAQLGEGRFV